MAMGMIAPAGGGFTDGARMVGAAELGAEFKYRGAWSRQRSISIAIATGKALVEAATQNASGRPGPNRVTGDYVNSFYYEVVDDVETASVYAGTDEPYAMRLEYGFVGIDSLGRDYHQPPFPHWGPAADIVEPMYEESLIQMTDFGYVI